MTYKQETIIKEVSNTDEVLKATISFKDGTTFMIDRSGQKAEDAKTYNVD